MPLLLTKIFSEVHTRRIGGEKTLTGLRQRTHRIPRPVSPDHKSRRDYQCRQPFSAIPPPLFFAEGPSRSDLEQGQVFKKK